MDETSAHTGGVVGMCTRCGNVGCHAESGGEREREEGNKGELDDKLPSCGGSAIVDIVVVAVVDAAAAAVAAVAVAVSIAAATCFACCRRSCICCC